GDGARRGVDAALRLGLGHALHPVAARFELEPRVGALSDDARDDLLVAAELGRALGDDLDLPALALGIAGVHAEDLAGEERRLVAARARSHLEEDVALVVRVLGQQRLLQLAFDPLHCGTRILQIFGEIELARRLGVALGLAVVFVQRHQVRELGALARELPELVHVARGVLGRKQPVQVVQAPDQAVELRAQRGFHLMRKSRESVSARTRPSSPAASFSACVGACSSLAVSPCDRASSTAAGASPRCSARSARSSSWSRACSPCSRSARMSGTFSRACIQRMNWPTWVSMITSACSTAERRESRLSETICARSSTVYRN